MKIHRNLHTPSKNILYTHYIYTCKVYSKWWYAFLCLRSSECTCVGLGMHMCKKKILVLFQESFNATTIFLQLRHFLLDVSQEVRVGPIKSNLPYMAWTCCCDLLSRIWIDQFLRNSKQAKHAASGILKRNEKDFPLRLKISGFSLNRIFVLFLLIQYILLIIESFQLFYQWRIICSS